jgi:nicotinamide-nucleotide amidase
MNARLLHRLLLSDTSQICVGESFTAGRLSAALTAYAGSSRYFLGGIIYYDPRIKRAIGIQTNQVVSKRCAEEAARRVYVLFQSYGLNPTLALATTGKAEPDGTFFVSLFDGQKTVTVHRTFRGKTRKYVQNQGVAQALELIGKQLKSASLR